MNERGDIVTPTGRHHRKYDTPVIGGASLSRCLESPGDDDGATNGRRARVSHTIPVEPLDEVPR
ncbi:hypothetical protein CP557_13860 [Natrinema ejinorense]|uniref:Uncharacterized protein n=1 Tax=Natrinema ejinorense TaxID=373386 RepID=A0A2A5QXI3_9EURY|nr:hypothetical protein CP557_13860 [Natrinema ejinorense]